MECSSGTVFDDQTNRCDWAYKTSCGTRQLYVKTATPSRPPISSKSSTQPIASYPQTTGGEEPFHGEGLINIRIARGAPHPQKDDWDSFISGTISHVNRPKRHAMRVPIRCENGATGLFVHPFDCSKFLQCDKGRTFIMDCFAGTVFNDMTKICDWPQKTNCGARQLNVNGATHPTTRPAPNSHRQQHPQNRNNQRPSSSPQLIRGQTQNQVNQIAPSRIDEISARALDLNQPNVEIVSLQNEFPEVNVMSKRVGGEFLKYFAKKTPQTHAKSSENAHKRPIILKITPQQFLDTNLVSKRVGNEFKVYFVNPKSNPTVNLRLSPSTEIEEKQKLAPIDYITLVQQGTPYVLTASQQFPQVNLMSPTVGNEFYRYFSQVKPKSTPKKEATENSRNTKESEPQASPGLFHGQPELNRKVSSPLDNYNRLYWNHQTKEQLSQNANERNDETANVLISDNLKQLLHPYFDEKVSKAKTKSKSTDAAVVPRLPLTGADVDTFTTTPRPLPRPSFRPQSRFPEPPTSRKPPTYHRSGPHDPNKIYFPGPHSQSHPMNY